MSKCDFDFAVINLKERTDRWEKIMNNFKDFKIFRIDAIKTNPGKIGCFQSHQKAIKLAKELNMDKIFVLEDDCIPCKDFKERFTIIKKYLETQNNWDLYLGGGIIKPEWCKDWENNFKESLCYKDENFVRISKSYGFHFVCYNKSVYDYYLNIDRFRYLPDQVWHMGYKMPKLNAIISYPFIGIQDQGWSDITNAAESTEGKRNLSQKLLKEFIEKSI